MNVKRIIISGLLATALFVTGGFIQFDTGNISVNQYTADILSVDKVNSYALLEKTGSIVDSKVDKIRLRFDLYLTENAPGYDNWHIREYTVDEKTGIKDYTGEWVNTPYLCVFVYVNADDTDDYIKQLAETITIQAYNHYINYKTVRNVNLTLNPLLKAQYAIPDTSSELTKDIRLFNIENNVETYTVNPDKTTFSIGGSEVLLAADPIDVGGAATDRANDIPAPRTIIGFDNPSNGTGVLDTIEIWAETNTTGTKVGTFYGSGADWTSRDYETIGNVTSGAKRTFTGLSIDVTTLDILGVYIASGAIERDLSGYGGIGQKYETDTFGTGEASYTLLSGDAISLYATGETTGPVAPTITNSTGASNITHNSARLNGELTSDGGATTTVTVYWGDNDGVTTAGNWDNNYSLGEQAAGTFYHDVSLSGGTTYYYRYYASNSEGSDWADSTESFLTKPAAPTNVSATDGTHTDKVTITWTKSTGATGYKVYEGANLLDTLGDVATYDDTAAPAGVITPGTATASDGTSAEHVTLTVSGHSVANGTSRTYKVVATNATGDSPDSATDTGYRTTGSITYQWQRSAADSDASYSNIAGATTNPYNDTAGEVDPDGRYYQCVLSATGAANQTTTTDRGYMAAAVPPTVSSVSVLGFGRDWVMLKGTIDDEGDAGVTEVGFDYGPTDAYGSDDTTTGTYTTGNSFVSVITGLTQGTVYNWRAKAYSTEGWGYGDNMYASTEGSPVIYEYLNENNDGASGDIYGNNWGGQSFTVGSTSHTVTSIRVYIKRTGSPGTITISLRHGTEALLPTGTDLLSGTIDGDAISTGYVWYTIEATEDVTLEAGGVYSLVIRAVSGDTDNDVQWASDEGGSLDNAVGSYSTDGGITWTSDTPEDYLFEVWGEPALSIEDAKAYSDYKETGDLLFLINYFNVYPPYYPSSIVTQYFYLQILDTDGITVLHQVPVKQWGLMPGSIYLNADTAASIDISGDYYVRIYGNFTGTPSASYQLEDADWISGEANLKDWIIGTAFNMEDYYNAELTTSSVTYGTILNETGGAAFAVGISDLINVLPEIFSEAAYSFIHSDAFFENEFGNAYTWQQMVGTQLEDVADQAAAIFGIDAKTVIALALLMLYLGVGIFCITKGHALAGLALAFPFLIAAALLRVIDIQMILIIGLLAIIIFVVKFIIERFG